MTLQESGEVVLAPAEAHCIARLLAQADEDTRLALKLNRTESAVLDAVYDGMARAGVGGHAGGVTPPYYGTSVEAAA